MFRFFAVFAFTSSSQTLDNNYWEGKRNRYIEKFGNFDAKRTDLSEKEKDEILNFLLEDYRKSQRARIGEQLNVSVSFYVQGKTVY